MNIDEKYNKLLDFFREISKIPRNSKEEEKVSNYICDFANEHGLEYRQDELFNVLVKKKATKGFESKKPIVFQAHIDMVCEKTPESTHDFTKDEIEIIENEETFNAKDTTLGADDGIGVALLLLMLDDCEINHPDIYCLFTTQEEIGMDGAKYFDYSDINAGYLINVDGEEENTAIVGCAGGITLTYTKEYKVETTKDDIYELKVSGLYGGHSGVDINKNRINANYLTAKILSKLENIKISSFVGGNKDNAIPSSANSIFTTDSKDINNIINEIKNNLDISKEDKSLKIECRKIDDSVQVISNKESKEIIDLILNLKQGVIEMSSDIDDLVETSGNVGIVKIQNEKALVKESIRSSVDNKKYEIEKYNNEIAEKMGYKINVESDYPGWKYNPKSNIEKVYVYAYKRTHNGEEPIVCAIHAGVECGLIYEKMPNIELISIGPDVVDVHTVKETLYIQSCKKLLATVFEMINNLD